MFLLFKVVVRGGVSLSFRNANVLGVSVPIAASGTLFVLVCAQDALEYGLIDEVIAPNAGKAEKAAAYWLKSGRAEGDGRLEQWQEYLELQEKYSMQDQFRKVGHTLWSHQWVFSLSQGCYHSVRVGSSAVPHLWSTRSSRPGWVLFCFPTSRPPCISKSFVM